MRKKEGNRPEDGQIRAHEKRGRFRSGEYCPKSLRMKEEAAWNARNLEWSVPPTVFIVGGALHQKTYYIHIPADICRMKREEN